MILQDNSVNYLHQNVYYNQSKILVCKPFYNYYSYIKYQVWNKIRKYITVHKDDLFVENIKIFNIFQYAHNATTQNTL